MRLAAQTTCTLEELGERMSAEEFGLWIAFLEEEPIGHTSTFTRLAEILCALANGPLKPPNGRKAFRPSDFMEKRWQAPSQLASGEPPMEAIKLLFGG